LDAVAIDRATFHRDTVASLGLPASQAWVHSGLLFGWAVERGLVADWLRDRTPDAFAAYADRRCTGPELLAAWDGNLLDDMFTDEGLAFVVAYFGTRGTTAGLGTYLEDYRDTLCRDLPSEYHVADTPENQARIARVLDERLAHFRAIVGPEPERPDLRQSATSDAFAGPAWLPAVPLPDAIALPHATIGVVASRPETRRAIDHALAHPPHRLVLQMDDVPVGVLARVVHRRGERVLLGLVARVREATDPVGEPPIPGAAWVERLAEPPWTAEHEGFASEIRTRIGAIVARHRASGDPPSNLALALAHAGLAMLDLAAGDLLETTPERARMLCASTADDRVHIVLEALRKATAD